MRIRGSPSADIFCPETDSLRVLVVLTEQTRYRVTGAVFLLAMAGILLPMLFDGGGIESIDLPSLKPTNMAVPAVETPPDMTAVLADADTLRDEVDNDGFLSGSGGRVGEPILIPEAAAEQDPSAIDAWAVQVASFSQRNNAVALRDKLLGDGYQAMLSSHRDFDNVRTRVAVGPFVNKDDAGNLQTELAERYGLDAMVVRFSH